jgi:hypothetical protein
MADVFSNTSNDYIYPALSQCPNVADSNILKFLPNGEIGIVSGSKIISSISFSDVAIQVNSFNKQQQIIEPGEVIFIAGLTKGLFNKQQGFWFPNLGSSTLNPFFMEIDLSINYYKNFKYTYSNIEASANYSENLDIQDALNIVFNDLLIKVSSFYDASALDFQGSQEGYDFNISNVLLTLIDASQNADSPFTPIIVNSQRVPIQYTLTEDPSMFASFAKYINTAMQGVILKGTFPTNDNISEEDKWLYLNHVSNYITVYDPVTTIYNSDVSTELIIYFDSSTILGTKYPIDISIGETDASLDVSTGTFDSSILDWVNATNVIITNSIISNSNVYDSSINDSSINNSYITDCSVENIIGNVVMFENNVIWDSSVASGVFLNNVLIDNSINISVVSGTILEQTVISDSSITGASVINNKSIVLNSYIEDSWTNAYVLLVNPSTGYKIYVTEDDSLNIDLSSNRINIYNSIIWDSSLNNTNVYDSSIYSSFIEDSSLIRCTVYNSIYDSVNEIDTRSIMIDSSLTSNFEINQDTSLFYTKHVKQLDVGMNGNSTDDIMSAGDYLEYVTTNNLWKKARDMYIWTTTIDSVDYANKNLIDGFYVFNPHEFQIQIDYMIFI